MYTEQELIDAIRNHKLIGRGSCTVIDECYDKAELWPAFGIPAGNMTLEDAVDAAIKRCDIWVERMVDARFGDDDDVELKIRDEWEAEKAHFEAELAESVKS